MEIKKILVPIDFSEFSEKALQFAVEMADKFNAKLTLLHAVVLFQEDVEEEQRLQEYEEWVKRREIRLNDQMNKNKQKVDNRGLEVHTTILRGVSAADTILEYLDDNIFDLIIMGTHGRSGLKHFLHGSVAEKVLRLSPFPVLTVHRSVQNFQFKKILVPIDFSPYAKKVTDYAVYMAKEFNSELCFIHVIEQDIHPSFYAAGVESIFEIDKDLKNRVIHNMREFLEDQLDLPIKCDYVVREGKAHNQIVEYSKKHEIDLIAIATHGLTGLDYVLLGSTAEKVVRWANCPVLTVKR